MSDHMQAGFSGPGMDAPAFGDESPAFTIEQIQAMQRAMVRLFAHWNLTAAQAGVLLGGISPRTFQRWKKHEYGRVSHDTAIRMSHFLGIHVALRVILDKPESVHGWVHRPNTQFEERSGLEIMMSGRLEDVVRMRRYLDAMTMIW